MLMKLLLKLLKGILMFLRRIALKPSGSSLLYLFSSVTASSVRLNDGSVLRTQMLPSDIVATFDNIGAELLGLLRVRIFIAC